MSRLDESRIVKWFDADVRRPVNLGFALALIMFIVVPALLGEGPFAL